MAINDKKGNMPDVDRQHAVCSKCGREFATYIRCPDMNGKPVCYKCCWRCTYNEKVEQPGSVLHGQRRCSLVEAAKRARGKKR